MSFILIDPSASETLYAVSSEGRVYRSQNGGILWSNLSGEARFPSPRFVALQAEGTKALYVGTRYGCTFSRALE